MGWQLEHRDAYPSISPLHPSLSPRRTCENRKPFPIALRFGPLGRLPACQSVRTFERRYIPPSPPLFATPLLPLLVFKLPEPSIVLTLELLAPLPDDLPDRLPELLLRTPFFPPACTGSRLAAAIIMPAAVSTDHPMFLMKSRLFIVLSLSGCRRSFSRVFCRRTKCINCTVH
jgi:hypothetical protein